MWNVTVWMLVAAASACTVGSVFLPPYQSRMRRVDTVELRRHRHMVEVLQSNSRPFPGEPLNR